MVFERFRSTDRLDGVLADAVAVPEASPCRRGSSSVSILVYTDYCASLVQVQSHDMCVYSVFLLLRSTYGRCMHQVHLIA